MKLGKWVKDNRKNHGISQTWLAGAMGVAQSTVSRIEDEKLEPTVDQLKEFIWIFKVSDAEIVEMLTKN